MTAFDAVGWPDLAGFIFQGYLSPTHIRMELRRTEGDCRVVLSATGRTTDPLSIESSPARLDHRQFEAAGLFYTWVADIGNAIAVESGGKGTPCNS